MNKPENNDDDGGVTDAPVESPRERILTAARILFDGKGFHSTAMAELAAKARVSVGQIYRFFPGKDDLIVAIVDVNVAATVKEVDEIFAAVARGECSTFDAIKAIARASLNKDEGGLIFEMLAETYRNPRVAAAVERFIVPYQSGIRRLALLIRPGADSYDIDAYTEIMMACFFGLGHRTLIRPVFDVERLAEATASMLMQALAGNDRSAQGG